MNESERILAELKRASAAQATMPALLAGLEALRVLTAAADEALASRGTAQLRAVASALRDLAAMATATAARCDAGFDAITETAHTDGPKPE